MPKYFAIVPAAGSGTRFGAELPKQYLLVNGKPLIYYALSVLCACPAITRVWVVLSPGDAHWSRFDWTALEEKLRVSDLGGSTRAQSVIGGLQAAAAEAAENDWVLVHDAARPCLSAAALQGLIAQVAEDPVGGILALPVADTLKRADTDGRILATEPRQGLWQAQTPQMFRYRLLREALEQASDVTDEAGAVEAMGHRPCLVHGESTNLKVTYPADLVVAGSILSEVLK
ncbi:MAG: 2-C-methyl-D-erythritol 4-phosphate cytidylyltransferase [Betaproteobacteria bacterium ADurb.Bin341]|nr:MAG: 2-C-methyl-D-erythritol 4-phosphate cytidylyltransferase [Betaproteobacteria bacterium ADurb.Bin341]